MIRKTWVALSFLALATATHGGLVDDFDNLPLGNINGQAGWAGTAEFTGTGTGEVAVDPVGGGADRVLSIAGADNGGRGVYKPLGANAIAKGSIATLTFDFMVNSGTNNQSVYFGLSNGGAAEGFDFEAYVAYINRQMTVRNGAAAVPIKGFTLDSWHTFKLVVNTTTDTYDVFMDNTRVGANLVFRNSTAGAKALDLNAVRLWAGSPPSSGTSRGFIDNIKLSNNTAPGAQIQSFSAAAPLVQRPAPVVLRWAVSGTVSSLVIEPGIGDVKGLTSNGAGSVEVFPTGSQDYTLKLNGVTESVASVIGLPEKQKLHIYLMIGQSNMQGEGQYYNASLDATHPRILKFGSRDRMETEFAKGGHRLFELANSTGGKIGMGLEFGKAMLAAQSDPEVVICLINHGMGDSAIQWWAPGVMDNKQINPATGLNYHLYDEAVQRAHDAENYGVLKGVLWHQGEYNSGNQKNPDSEPELYAGRQQALVDNLRSEFNNPSLPFVCGKFVPTSWVDANGKTISYNRPADRLIIEAAGDDLPNHRKNTFCVSNEGLRGHANEMIHFDAYSQRLLGQRYAAAMLSF